MDEINRDLLSIDRFKKKKPAPHERADMVNQLCELFSETDKKDFGKWLGFTKGIPVPKIYEMLNASRTNGKPPKRLFIWLVREYRKSKIKV